MVRECVRSARLRSGDRLPAEREAAAARRAGRPGRRLRGRLHRAVPSRAVPSRAARPSCGTGAGNGRRERTSGPLQRGYADRELETSDCGLLSIATHTRAEGPCPEVARLWQTAKMGTMGNLILLRHGETEWSRDGRHTGRTDVPLTPRGEAAAASLAPMLARMNIVAVFTSPASRAVHTADLAGLADAKPDADLWEWDYGGYEGRTTKEIRQERPGWYLWRDGVVPGDAEHPGETVGQVGTRVDRVLGRARPLLADGNVALVAHGHVLRVLTARWLRLDPSGGRLFRLDTGTVSTLGTEHEEPVILTWNLPPAVSPEEG